MPTFNRTFRVVTGIDVANTVVLDANRNLSNITSINASTFVTSSGLDVTGQANTATTVAQNAYGAANNRVLKAGDTMTGQLNISSGGLTVESTTTLQQTREKLNVSATAMSANLTIDLLSGAITYLTANSTANSTINFRGNSTATLDSILAANQSMSSVIMITNGATAYRIANVQIDGTTVTPKWSGNTTPTANTNAIDIFAFTLIKTAANTYTVLGSKTEFV